MIRSQKNWLWQIENSTKTPEQLFKSFKFSEGEKQEILERFKETRVSITPYLLALIETKNGKIIKNDPIWLQYGPSRLEGELLQEETDWEQPQEMFADGLGQHKYPDRVLIRISHHCAAYCRFCYERARTLKNMKMANLTVAREKAVKYVKKHPQVREVIFSGGDPLMLTDAVLEGWFKAFREIKTVDSLRIHTRFLAQNPYRVTAEFIDLLKKYGVRWINVQVNHPCEITEDFLASIKKLQERGIVVKTQNTIFHGINDDPKILAELIRKCRAYGIQHHHWSHPMPVTPKALCISVTEMVLLFQAVKRELGGIRWNHSELGDVLISHSAGKRNIPFEEINIDFSRPREEWGTNNFKFTVKNGNPVVLFTSWSSDSKKFYEYPDDVN